jgi:hypothetical protein
VGKFIKQAFLSQSQYNRLVNKADRIERELIELHSDIKDVLSSLSLNITHDEYVPQKDDEQIGADNPPDSLMPLNGLSFEDEPLSDSLMPFTLQVPNKYYKWDKETMKKYGWDKENG